MTIQTAIAISARAVRELDTGLYDVTAKPTLPATAAGDSQVLLTMPVPARLYGAHLTVPNNLGSGVICKLQKRDATSGTAVDITAASTAATAGIVSGTGIVPIDVGLGDTIEVLLAGGTSTAQAIAYDLDKVRGDLWRPGTSGVPDDVCDRALHASLLEIEAERRWLWLENIRHSADVDEEVAVIPLPPDLRSVTSLAMQLDDGCLDAPLTTLPIGQIRFMASNQSGSGWPRHYALTGGEAFLDCNVPAGTSFDLVYTAGTPERVEDAAAAATNTTLSLHQAIVIAGACASVALTYLKNEAEAARQQTFFTKALDRLSTIEDDARGDVYGGLIVPDAWGTL